jgi:hypothetical protein
MKTLYTIGDDNNISAFAELPADAIRTEAFATEKELTRLSADWPASRLLDLWNSFAGVAPFDDLKPVKKFTDRKAALGRLWKAIQRLTPTPMPIAANDEPETDDGDKDSTAAPEATKPAKNAKTAKKVREPKASGGTDREGGKKAEVLALLKRPTGATLKEIMAATNWQAHSVRGFISGALGKRMGLTVESTRREDGERVYQLR